MLSESKITAICNQKGGVGKTVTSVNLGIGFARTGKRVLLVDVDAQGSLTASLGYQRPDQIETTLASVLGRIISDEPLVPGEGIIHHKEGIDLLPANIELSGLEVTLVNTMSRETILREYLNSVRDQYDVILLDCCPSLGMLTINALAAADEVLIPCQAHFLSIKGMEQLGWYMTDHEFEDYEVKMLVDAVAAAKFLTIEDSRRLIAHIRTALATQEGERLIDATMIMDQAIKIRDRQFKIKFDTVLRAVAAKRQIRFQYQELAPGNQMRLRKQGYVYQISPYFLILNDDDYDEYYVIGNVSRYDSAAHFRVELMANLEVTDQPIRPIREIEGLKEIGKSKTIADYLRETVHMWHGDVANVTLSGMNSCRYHVLKKFGHDVYMQDDGEDRFIAHVTATDGEGFYQWLASYGPYITITAPEEMCVQFKNYLKRTLQKYEKEG